MYEYSDYNSWENWNEWSNRNIYREWKDSRPVCSCCGEPVLDEYCYEFPNGDTVCSDCLNEYIWDHHRKFIG